MTNAKRITRRERSEAAELARLRTLIALGVARTARRAAGLSLSEMGRTVGVAHTTVMRWEKGKTVPHGARALRFLAVLDELMNGPVAR
jgi:DNA-binding transcriptional regulator YiaG